MTTMTDYNAGAGLTEATLACQQALARLQRLGATDQADGPLTDAENAAGAYTNIDGDTSRSDQWKLSAYARRYTDTMTTLARKLTAAATTAGRQDTTDAANVFGIAGLPGDVASLAIASRDAQDRAAAVTDTSQRQALLAQAVRNGDATLARALVQSAFDANDTDTINAFMTAFPEIADAVDRLWTAQNQRTTGLDLTTAWRLGALKPRALAALQDYEIALAASGQTTNR
jgi:hypothetical protein